MRRIRLCSEGSILRKLFEAGFEAKLGLDPSAVDDAGAPLRAGRT